MLWWVTTAVSWLPGCQCDIGGAITPMCTRPSGVCQCREHVVGKTCQRWVFWKLFSYSNVVEDTLGESYPVIGVQLLINWTPIQWIQLKHEVRLPIKTVPLCRPWDDLVQSSHGCRKLGGWDWSWMLDVGSHGWTCIQKSAWRRPVGSWAKAIQVPLLPRACECGSGEAWCITHGGIRMWRKLQKWEEVPHLTEKQIKLKL